MISRQDASFGFELFMLALPIAGAIVRTIPHRLAIAFRKPLFSLQRLADCVIDGANIDAAIDQSNAGRGGIVEAIGKIITREWSRATSLSLAKKLCCRGQVLAADLDEASSLYMQIYTILFTAYGLVGPKS
jgi:hypothetical protein